ncbi:hypothetical protein EJ110_NYTH17016 [Nymphaea thermarum]|nr:hypothetical protein EJ110_NYTH17016 [Nymphaea thermarum]
MDSKQRRMALTAELDMLSVKLVFLSKKFSWIRAMDRYNEDLQQNLIIELFFDEARRGFCLIGGCLFLLFLPAASASSFFVVSHTKKVRLHSPLPLRIRVPRRWLPPPERPPLLQRRPTKGFHDAAPEGRLQPPPPLLLPFFPVSLHSTTVRKTTSQTRCVSLDSYIKCPKRPPKPGNPLPLKHSQAEGFRVQGFPLQILCLDCDTISVTAAGRLRFSKPNKYWVERSQKRLQCVSSFPSFASSLSLSFFSSLRASPLSLCPSYPVFSSFSSVASSPLLSRSLVPISSHSLSSLSLSLQPISFSFLFPLRRLFPSPLSVSRSSPLLLSSVALSSFRRRTSGTIFNRKFLFFPLGCSFNKAIKRGLKKERKKKD